MRTKIILGFLLILFGLLGCFKDDNSYRSSGKIIGSDMTLCPTPCCGGWIIEMDGSNYGFDSLPSGCKIDLQTATFPIFVKLDWQRAMNICSNNRIVIQRIVRYYPLD